MNQTVTTGSDNVLTLLEFKQADQEVFKWFFHIDRREGSPDLFVVDLPEAKMHEYRDRIVAKGLSVSISNISAIQDREMLTLEEFLEQLD